jgi:hypothetical protein
VHRLTKGKGRLFVSEGEGSLSETQSLGSLEVSERQTFVRVLNPRQSMFKIEVQKKGCVSHDGAQEWWGGESGEGRRDVY